MFDDKALCVCVMGGRQSFTSSNQTAIDGEMSNTHWGREMKTENEGEFKPPTVI